MNERWMDGLGVSVWVCECVRVVTRATALKCSLIHFHITKCTGGHVLIGDSHVVNTSAHSHRIYRFNGLMAIFFFYLGHVPMDHIISYIIPIWCLFILGWLPQWIYYRSRCVLCECVCSVCANNTLPKTSLHIGIYVAVSIYMFFRLFARSHMCLCMWPLGKANTSNASNVVYKLRTLLDYIDI